MQVTFICLFGCIYIYVYIYIYIYIYIYSVCVCVRLIEFIYLFILFFFNDTNEKNHCQSTTPISTPNPQKKKNLRIKEEYY
jgi:hypothetical protein